MSLPILNNINASNNIPYCHKKSLNINGVKRSTMNNEINGNIAILANNNNNGSNNNIYGEVDISLLDIPGLTSSDDEIECTTKENKRHIDGVNLSNFELSESSKKNKMTNYNKNFNCPANDFSDDDYLSDIDNSIRDITYFLCDKKDNNYFLNNISSENKIKISDENRSNIEVKMDNNLDHLNINVKKNIINIISDIEKTQYNYNTFNKPIQLSNISLYSLLNYKNFSAKIEELFFDKLAQMIFVLHKIVKKNGIVTCQNCYDLFKNLYYIDDNLFKKWTGLKFIEFMGTKWCSPYFKVIYDKIKHEYVVEKFNESNGISLTIDNKYIMAQDIKNTFVNDEINLFNIKLNEISDTLKIYQEKLKWLEFLSYRPRNLEIILLSLFCYNFKNYFGVSLNSNYLKSKFRKNTLSKVINSYFSHELQLIREIGNVYIKIVCKIPLRIVETKKIIKFMEKKQLGKEIKRNDNYESNVEVDFQKENFDVLKFNKEKVNDMDTTCSDEKIILNKKINKKIKKNHNNKKTDYIYSNVVLSEEEENSINE